MPRQYDVDVLEIGQNAHDPELVVDVHVSEIGKEVSPLGGVDRNQDALLRNMDLDEVIAVGRAEIEEPEVHVAQPQVHLFLEGDGRDDRVAVLSHQMGDDVRVTDPDRRVTEDPRVAIMVLMVVAQDHVPHRDVVPAVEF